MCSIVLPWGYGVERDERRNSDPAQRPAGWSSLAASCPAWQVRVDTSLFALMRQFEKGRSHMALVVDMVSLSDLLIIMHNTHAQVGGDKELREGI
jgi:hypothetical protein